MKPSKLKQLLTVFFISQAVFAFSQGTSSSTTTTSPTGTTTTAAITTIPEVKVNLDSKLFESSLPVGQDFILTIYSTSPLTITDFALVGYRKASLLSSYIKFFRVEMSPFTSTGSLEISHVRTTTATSYTSQPTVATASTSTDATTSSDVGTQNTTGSTTANKDITTSSQTTVPGKIKASTIAKTTTTTPVPPDTKQVIDVKTEQFTTNNVNSVHYLVRKGAIYTNTDYCLLTEAQYTLTTTEPVSSVNLLSALLPKSPLTDTWLSYQNATLRNVTVIIGASYFKAQTQLIRPYLGFRLNFLPIDNNMQARQYSELYLQNNPVSYLLSRMSFDVGITLVSVKDTVHKQYDLFGGSNLMTGLGFKLGNAFFLSGGVLWYDKLNDTNPKIDSYMIKPSFYLSLSFDWNISGSFNSIKSALGATSL